MIAPFPPHFIPGSKGVAPSVTCLTADPGVASSIAARSHTFVEIDHEIISTAILLPTTDSRTDCPDMTIAVDLDVKNQTKQTHKMS